MVVKSPFERQVTELLPNQQILRFVPNHHVRRKNGERQLYLALDKQHKAYTSLPLRSSACYLNTYRSLRAKTNVEGSVPSLAHHLADAM